MEKAPDYVKEYLSTVPTNWDDTEFIDGYPGKLVILARRKGEGWYVSGINGEDQVKSIEIDLSFIGEKEGILISDGKERFSFTKSPVDLREKQNVVLQPNSGFVMKF